ncbi:MAG: FAD:protein FMN transferase [Desulfovibrionaceae bacterium]
MTIPRPESGPGVDAGRLLTRRSLLRVLVASAGAAALAPAARVLALDEPAPGRLTRARALMGTFVSITVAHPSPALAEEAVGRAFAVMDRQVALFNRFDPASALSTLNDAGRMDGPPPELTALLADALGVTRLTAGAFDPTVGPLVDVLRDCAGTNRDPDPARLQAALALVDPAGLRLAPGRVRLARRGMGLTLDGMAKGAVADAASAELTRLGAVNHIIDAGGDIRASGRREDGRPWRVAVRDPLGTETPAAVLAMTSGAVATSGGYETLSGPHGRLHHLVDPHSGRCPLGLAGVSVRAASVALADALATAFFVTPPDRTLALARELPGVEVLLVTHDGARLATPGFC